MIRPSFVPLLLAAGLGLTVAAPALAKEKPTAEDAASDAKADKKKPAKPDAKKTEPAKKIEPGDAKKPADAKSHADKKPADAKKSAEAKKGAEAKKTAEAKKPAAAEEEPDAKSGKDKNGKAAKAGKEKPAEKEKAGAKTPTAVGSYGDWNAMTAHGQGKDKTCYALAEPKDRQPAKLQRDKAYVFISTRPAEGVRNEVAIILGFAAKDGAAASADIDGDNFELVTKGSNAWVKNPAKEKEFVEALKSGTKLTVKAPSAKGNVTTDVYSLKGLSDALGRVQKECP